MVTDPDEDILSLIRAGERDKAIRLLMQRYGDAVYRFVRGSLRGSDSVDDVHSRVFIQADRDLPRFRGASSLRSWLFAIARHRILDQVKSDKSRGARTEPLDGVEVPHQVASAGELLDDAQLRGALLQCMERLQLEVRQAVLLRYQQGFSFEDMSVMTAEKAGTLQARVSRALPTLKRCIETRTQGRV
jgi:RNA polymerase sigma factor (sigma-70 family)